MNKAIQELEASPVRRHANGADKAEPETVETKEPTRCPVYNTLEALVKAEPVGEKGKRPYRVRAEGISVYVYSNSAGNAALELCDVEAVTQKELLAALANAVKQTN